MTGGDTKLILIGIAVWLFCYGVNCVCALPDGRHNESDYIDLPKPLAYVLFLPLAIGRCSGYLLICVLLQIALFLFVPSVFILEYLAHIGIIAGESIATVLKLAFIALVAIGLIAHLIRWLVKRPRRYKPRRRTSLRRRSRRRMRRR